MEETKRTELSTLGEFGLINRIKGNFTLNNKESVKGIGDDTAVLEYSDSEYVLLSTDMLAESVHFDLSYVPLRHLGYKAVAVNVSDIAAMNGIPKQIVVSLALSNKFSVEALDELYLGIEAACKNYKIDLVGGDTTSSRSGLIINIAVTGTVKKEEITYRSTANVGDLICVTGDLGGAFTGLQILEREKQVYLTNPDMQPDLEGKDYIVQKQLRPEARMDIVHEFKELKLIPTSMIDVSDGLASELLHICKQSVKGAVIYDDKLPIDNLAYETATEFNLDPITCILNGGEDYELLFTIKQEDFEKIKNHADISVIGHIVDKAKGVNLMTKSGNAYPVTAQGWVHF
ncbi:MAG TPA: thiamine-phosphate kinase [Cytophagaceae bacterium]|jgi:thiamine-monophosphate kinase